MYFKPQAFFLRASWQQQAQLYLRGATIVATQQRAFVKSLEERKEDNDKKAFQDDIKYFLGKDTFTVHDFHERVLHGLKQKSTFKMMVWGEDSEVKVLEGQNKICSAMYDDEKLDPKHKITAEKKRDIAETT